MSTLLNSSSVSGYNSGHLRDKLSHQLETIVRKTQKNLDQGVFKNPNNLTSLNQIGAVNQAGLTQTPNYRANSMGIRNLGGRLGTNNSMSGMDALAFGTQADLNEQLLHQQSTSLLMAQQSAGFLQNQQHNHSQSVGGESIVNFYPNQMGAGDYMPSSTTNAQSHAQLKKI